MNIILIGYMGSGKSSVAKDLQTILGLDWVDLDDYIEAKENSSISELFKLKGEIYFRKKESFYLNKLLTECDSKIISLGGGTPCYGTNMDLITSNNKCYSIYLKTSITDLSDRLFPEREKRPLISHLNSKEELMEFIGKHLFERLPFYDRCDVTINTDTKDTSEIAKEIVATLF